MMQNNTVKMQKSLRICPKCKSTDVAKDFSATSYAQSSFFNQYKCNKCNYSSQFFPEVDIKKKKTK
jgi:transposase-like protein|tara:strand:- start:4850 stop:5047 length:198 start_codon:yes stop_codon:yes gene_type:complete